MTFAQCEMDRHFKTAGLLAPLFFGIRTKFANG
jgi:hypothetical protein